MMPHEFPYKPQYLNHSVSQLVRQCAHWLTALLDSRPQNIKHIIIEMCRRLRYQYEEKHIFHVQIIELKMAYLYKTHIFKVGKVTVTFLKSSKDVPIID